MAHLHESVEQTIGGEIKTTMAQYFIDTDDIDPNAGINPELLSVLQSSSPLLHKASSPDSPFSTRIFGGDEVVRSAAGSGSTRGSNITSSPRTPRRKKKQNNVNYNDNDNDNNDDDDNDNEYEYDNDNDNDNHINKGRSRKIGQKNASKKLRKPFSELADANGAAKEPVANEAVSLATDNGDCPHAGDCHTMADGAEPFALAAPKTPERRAPPLFPNCGENNDKTSTPEPTGEKIQHNSNARPQQPKFRQNHRNVRSKSCGSLYRDQVHLKQKGSPRPDVGHDIFSGGRLALCPVVVPSGPPNFDTIVPRKALCHQFCRRTRKWTHTECRVRFSRSPFAKGSVRHAYYLKIDRPRNKVKQDNHSIFNKEALNQVPLKGKRTSWWQRKAKSKNTASAPEALPVPTVTLPDHTCLFVILILVLVFRHLTPSHNRSLKTKNTVLKLFHVAGT